MDAQLRLVPLGAIGELIVTGDGLARGYIDSQQNLNRFVSIEIDGRRIRAYRTGDYARYRPVDGQLEFFGRTDGQVKVRGQRIELGEIEIILRSHDSVHDAVVVSQQHGEAAVQLAAFISILGDRKELNGIEQSEDEDELQHVKVWEDLFDSDKYIAVKDGQPDMIGKDFTAWTSMYDGNSIDNAEMIEWLDDTVHSILNGMEPGNVLELGTGTGMILFNLIDGLQSYIGLEPKAKAIEFVTKTVRTIPALEGKVYLQKGTATDIGQLSRLNSPNLVVINSVVQYFPTQSYLLKVIENLLQIKGVKTIFFGDIRSYGLYEEFQVSKALHLLGETATKDKIRRQMTDTRRVEQELLVDPNLFSALPDRFPHLVKHVEILPKRMKATNELSCYRYSAVLYLKDDDQPWQIQTVNDDDWVDFMEQNLDQASLLRLLQHKFSSSSAIAVANIPHKKTILERHVVDSLAARSDEIINDRDWLSHILRETRNCPSLSAVDLEELARLVGCQVEISWARQHSQRGGLDAIFHHYQPTNKGTRALFNFPTDHSDRQSRSLTSQPLRQRLTQKIQSQLQERLRAQLPSYMIPQTITVLEHMPITENGKVDRQALAESVPKFLLPREPKQQPVSQMERQLQSIWGQVLYIDPATIGLEDNFFQLGGDSIVAMKAVALVRKAGVEMAVADIFKHPTLAAQARSRAVVTNDHTEIMQPFELLKGNQGSEDIREELAVLCNTDASLIEDAYPCTPLQEGLMSLTAQRQGDYIMQIVFHISEHTSLTRLKAAWEQVVASTAILRTRIVQWEPTGSTQVVCRGGLKWIESDNLEEYLQKDFLAPMEVGDDLSRFAIVSEGDGSTSHCLVWTIHHALYDGRSLPRIMKLASDIYSGKRAAVEPEEFNRFVRHIRQTKDTDAEAFWRSYLEDVEFSPFPALPTPVHEPVVNAVFETTLELDCQSSEVTISTILRGALAILISQHVSSADVTFGTVVSGRNVAVPGIEDILGPTIATIPVRVQVPRDQTVMDYLRTIQEQSTRVIDYEQTGLQRIISMGEDGRRGCGFQTLLVIQPHEDTIHEDSGLGTWRTSPFQQGFGNTYALVLECFPRAKEVKVKASFDSSVISKCQVQTLTRQLGAVLKQFADTEKKPRQRLGDINTLTSTEETMIWEWNKAVPKAINACVHDLFSRRAKLHPDSPAVNAWDGKLSYRELDDLSTSLARYLAHLGVGHGTIVPLVFEKSMWTIVAMLAVLKASGAFLLIDSTLAVERRDGMIKETGTKVILTSALNAKLMARPGFRIIPITFDTLHSHPKPKDEANHQDDDEPQSRSTPRSAAYVIFTSGSTGQPKGVLVDHGAVSTSCLYHGHTFGFSTDTRTLQFSAYTFDACIVEIITTLLFGGCICAPSDTQRLAELEESIDCMGVNMCFLTPTVARLLRPAHVPSLTTIILCGEKVSSDDFNRWTPSSTTFNGYGPAECTVCCAIGDSSTHQEGGSCIGRAIGSVSWIVSPEDHNRLVPIGAVGELLIEGAILAHGYLNRREETAAAFIENPTWLLRGTQDQRYPGRSARLYKTGDLVRYAENGTLLYVGRKDTQVKIRGQRVELSEIEQQVRECVPCVSQAIAVVTNLATEQNRPMLSVFLHSEDGRDGDNRTSSAFRMVSRIASDVSLVWLHPQTESSLSQRLPAYMIPTVYFRLDRLPLTTSGKIDRRKLRRVASALSPRELVELQMAVEGAKRMPRTQTERSLQKLWSQVLGIGVDSIGIDDSFHGLGGDSITAMKLVVAGRRVGIRLAVTDVLKHGSLATLAADQEQEVEEAQPAFSANPFALLDPMAKDEIVHTSESIVAPQEVADVYPVTGFQKNVIQMSMQWPRQSLNYIFIDFGADLDLDRLRVSCYSIVERFAMLRSAFISFRGTYLQIVLKKTPPQFSVFDVTDDLATASHSICLADTETGLQLGQPPTFFMLVQNKKSQSSRLIVRLSHAQYDGFCFPVVITSLLDFYQGKIPGPIAEFSDFLWHKRSRQVVSSAYWQRLLHGSTLTRLSQILLPEASRAAAQSSAHEKILVEDTVSMPELPDGINLASVISSAWAVVLSEITGNKDVVYGSLVSGRDVSMTGIENVVGPCVNIVPIRARVLPEQVPHELFQSIQRQNLAAQTHALGIDEIAKHSTGWPVDSDFDSVVHHQNIDENPEFDLSGSSLKLGWFENPYHLPPRLLIMSSTVKGNIRIRLAANTHITSVVVAESLLAGLCSTIISLITSQNQPLSSCKLDLHF
ncbi:hypothetical protein BJ170DRAFT_639720 [Xylariales sp. AK1849]|nr:hypothetical protein BJ170DRAFT_639720 [Xylariales sp. AK1849]